MTLGPCYSSVVVLALHSVSKCAYKFTWRNPHACKENFGSVTWHVWCVYTVCVVCIYVYGVCVVCIYVYGVCVVCIYVVCMVYV